MNGCSELSRAPGHLGDGLQSAHLVVGEAERNQAGVVRQIGFRKAVAVNGQQVNGVALERQLPSRAKHGLVLGGPGDK